MKILEWVKIFGFRRLDGNYHSQYKLIVNEVEAEKIVVYVNKLNSDTYKLLRNFKTPRYEAIYLMRKKRAFTTTFFQQHYDIVVCDRNFKVLKTFIDQKQGYISEHFTNGYFIYFAAVGTVNYYNIKVNDRVRINHDWLKF